jgi:hypothetical protein
MRKYAIFFSFLLSLHFMVTVIMGQPFLTEDEIGKLKQAGISDQTIQKMIEREERERARYLGITRVQKRADGTEQIVYGSVEPPPWPETEHFHFNTDAKYLNTLFLNIENQDLTSEEGTAWRILKNTKFLKILDGEQTNQK